MTLLQAVERWPAWAVLLPEDEWVVPVLVDPAATGLARLEAFRLGLPGTVREWPLGEDTSLVWVRLPRGWAAPTLRLPTTRMDRERYVFTIQAPDVDEWRIYRHLWVNHYATHLAAVELPRSIHAKLEAVASLGSIERVVVEPGELNAEPEWVGGLSHQPGRLLWSIVDGRWLTAQDYAERMAPDAAGPPVVVLANPVSGDAGHVEPLLGQHPPGDASFVAGLMPHATVVFRVASRGDDADVVEWRAISGGSAMSRSLDLRLLLVQAMGLERALRHATDVGPEQDLRFLAELPIDRVTREPNEPRGRCTCRWIRPRRCRSSLRWPGGGWGGGRCVRCPPRVHPSGFRSAGRRPCWSCRRPRRIRNVASSYSKRPLARARSRTCG